MHELFEHTADLGLRVRAATLPKLLAEAGAGLTAAIIDDPATIWPRETVEISIEGKDPAYLLFDWLNEILYLFETRRLLLCEFDVTLTETGASGTARGEIFDPARHSLQHEVKAITYHLFDAHQTDDGWEATVILDI